LVLSQSARKLFAGATSPPDEPLVTRVTRFPHAMGVMTRLAYAHAKAKGIAVGPMLKRAGLSRRQIDDTRARLPVRGQVQFLNLVAEASDDELLGFHLAQHFELRDGGLFYYVLASSHSLFEVCERGARYSALINEGVVQNLVDGREIGLCMQYAGVSRHHDRHQVEYWITALLRILRKLTGVRLVPQRIRLMHQRSRGAAEMARFFGCDIEFGASVDEILFARKVRDVRVVNADPYLNRILIAFCEQAMAQRLTSRGSFSTSVENAIAAALPHGKARASVVAKGLGLSQRTLARRLATEETSFSGLLTGLRRDLAGRYLKEEGLPIGQIAWLLGYQDVGAFSHAFKRWTGKAPRDAAKNAR
jgi:AraC-like DNA-binding protein